MLSFGWILMSLFPILMHQFTGTAGQERTFFSVKVGDAVTLPCANVKQEKLNCDRITWQYSQPGNRNVSWFERGSFTEEARAKSSRLSVTADCSLLINDITADDFGQYLCRRNLTDQKHDLMKVDLSVITMTEQRNNEQVTFNCSVSRYTYCRHKVVWLFEGKEKISSDMNVSASCSTAVTISTSHLHQNSSQEFYKLLKCKVTDGYNKKYFLFTFSHQSSVEKTGSSWWIVLVSAVIAGLLTAVMVAIRWKKTKGHKGQIEERTANTKEDVSYASVRFSKKTKKKSKLSAPIAETVTYSTLNASSPSSAVI
ncbi:uncharacterized protein LOC124881647 isoform X2 [Girardinichthys multiradiatus]|uniref:uncharacterized protein LOC124881647 isoform X2 n=1 Tax=Girardinichthys multiradiatus TaxID=208333 RepID=UPI001FADA20C|nr:uncharacterized protein LOC124881647 isoform X2 [Girardinichthys multiradiatus]